MLTFGPAGSVQRPPGDGAAVVAELADKRKALGKRLHAAERVALIWSGPGGRGGAALAPLAERSASRTSPAAARTSCPPRRTAAASPPRGQAAGEGEPAAPERVGLLLISGEEAVADPRVRALAERSDAVAAVTMFSESVRGWTHVVLPGHELSRARRHDGQPRRPRAAAAARRASRRAATTSTWIAELAARFGVTPSSCLRAELHGVVRRPAERAAAAGGAARSRPVAPKLRLTRYRALFSGSAVERVPQLQFQRPEPVIELSPEDAQKRSIERGRDGDRARERHVRRAPRADQPPARGRARRAQPRSTSATCPTSSRCGRERSSGSCISIEAFLVINILLLAFAYTTLLERKLLGRMQLRYGPNRAGWFGLLQPIADLLKLVRKEAFFPRKVEAIPYIVAPAFSAFTALLAFSVIPFGEGWEVARLRDQRRRRDRRHRPDRHLRARLDRRLRLHRRRLGLRVEVLAARLDADVRAARLVRGLAVALRDRRHPDRRVAQPLDDRREADRHDVVRRPAARRLRGLLHRRDGRDGAGAVRPRRGRLRDRRRLPHGVQRHALGPLPDGRVHQPHRPLGARGDALLRRLGRARGSRSARCGSC